MKTRRLLMRLGQLGKRKGWGGDGPSPAPGVRYAEKTGTSRPRPVDEMGQSRSLQGSLRSRSVPVPGRGNARLPVSFGKCGNATTIGTCCARGRARSGAVGFSAAILGLMLATTLFAQKEQWLEYRPSTEGYSYRYLELTTNPPAGMVAPKCNAQPYFGRWTTPLDPAGRWFCLDRSRKSGPYDRAYVDTTGNGRLDDKPLLAARRADAYSAYFEPVKLVFKGEDGPIAYHLLLRSMQYDNSKPQLLMSAGGSYAGTVDLGGKKVRIELLDGNVNGTFNDQGPELGDRDFVSVKGDSQGRRYLGRMIEIEGAFYRLEVARDGAFVKIQKAENVVLGKVQVPETLSEFVAVGENGHFARKPAKGEFSLPVGHYQIVDWTINRKDSKGAAWTLNGYNFRKSSEFDVTAAQPAVVAAGEPVRALLERRESAGRVEFNIQFRGPSDEVVQFQKGGQNPAPPKLMLTSADEVYRWTNSFEFG